MSLTASGGSSTISPGQVTTDSAGEAVFTLTDATAQVVTYSAEDVTDDVVLSAQVSVTFG